MAHAEATGPPWDTHVELSMGVRSRRGATFRSCLVHAPLGRLVATRRMHKRDANTVLSAASVKDGVGGAWHPTGSDNGMSSDSRGLFFA